MSQYDMAIAGTNSGTELVAALGSWEAALLSCHSGTTRPSYSVAGTVWMNTAATPWVVYMYDGTDDIQWGTFNATTNVFSPTIPDGYITAAKLAAALGLVKFDQSSDIASGTTVDLSTATGNSVNITHTSGTTTITSFAGATSVQAGTVIWCKASITSGTLSITHNATSLNIPGGSNWTLATGDIFLIRKTSDSLAYWEIIDIVKADGTSFNVINGLLDISGASGGQIKFPSTQNASADANTLDDYEEGTWTPTDGSGASLALSVTSATYTKTGNRVVADCYITYPVTADGSSARINGLPFTSAIVAACACSSNYGAVQPQTNAGTSIFPLGAGVVLTNSQLSTKYLIISVTYKV